MRMSNLYEIHRFSHHAHDHCDSASVRIFVDSNAFYPKLFKISNSKFCYCLCCTKGYNSTMQIIHVVVVFGVMAAFCSADVSHLPLPPGGCNGILFEYDS